MKMIMDEAMCDEPKSVQFFVSSDTYYGFIPPYCVQENQQELSRWNPWRNCRLEAIPWSQQWYNQQQQQQEDNVNMSFCRNRKRNRRDNDKAWPIEERKRPRREMATSALFVVQEAEKALKSETLDMDLDTDTANCTTVEQLSTTKENWAAGSPSIDKVDKHLLSSGDVKLNESNKDYEKLLFTTHGCTIYHHERILLNNQIDI